MAQDQKEEEPQGLISLGHRGLSTAEDEKELEKLLSDEKVDINTQDKQGLSCLHWACANGHKKLVERLILNGMVHNKDVNLNLKSKKGETALHKLAINTKDDQVTAIQLAKWFVSLSDTNNKDIKDILTQLGRLDINATNNWGETPLHCAIQNRNVEMVRLLLSSPDTNVSAADNWGRNPLDVSQEYGMTSQEQEQIWNLLTVHPAVTTQMVEDAEKRGKVEAPASCANSQSLTIVMSRNTEMKEEFLAKQAAMHQRLQNDENALDKLVNVNHAFNVGGKVLDAKKRENQEKIAKNGYDANKNLASLSKKIEFNSTDWNSFENMVKADHIDNDGTDMYGNTALHKVMQWAFSESKYIEYVKLLITNGNMSKKAVNAVDKSEGKTAFHMLVTTYLDSMESIATYEKSHPEFEAPSTENFEVMIRAMIQSATVDRNVKDKSGKTVVELVQARKQYMPAALFKLFE